jgi:hypothetical protein
MTKQSTLFESDRLISGAQFSECRTWRYGLWRIWDWQGHANCVAFIGLNPSTADETLDDPTIRRCIGFAKRWGFGGCYMLNAYAFRATDPRVMKQAADPVGPGNDEALAYYRSRVGLIIAAWGVHCEPERERRVCEVIGQPIYCLGKTKDGRPKHPLYLRADTEREIFWSP